MRGIQSTLFALLCASSAACADTALNLTPGVSPISRDVYALHMTIFWICVAIGLIVFGVMFYAIYYHRKSRGAKPAEFHSHPVLEIAWTIVPALILVVMAIPATKVLLRLNNDDKEAITIKITGYQWKWHYEYLEDGISFFSNLSTPYDQIYKGAAKSPTYLREVDHQLVVPVHKKIRFLVTSNDVNHAWWVPDLAVKRDAIAGFINEAWAVIDKPGTYYGQCAELCGVNHAFMPIVLIATSEQGYKEWVAQQKGEVTQGEADTNRAWTLDELTKQGEAVYGRICAACHQASGAGTPPTYPALKGSKVATGPIEGHIDTVFNGRPGTAMQAFKNQLTNAELAAVITYERNAWGNNKGDMVQPIQIKALRDGKSIADALATKPSAASAKATGAEALHVPAPAAATSTTTASAAAHVESVPATTPPAAAIPTDSHGAPASEPTPVAMPVQSSPSATAPSGASSASTANPPSSPAEELKAAMARGEKVYLGTCAACHQPSGVGMPPTFPALKGSAIAIGPVAGHIDRVMNGKPGTAMMPFKDQLNDQDLADVITYERNAWENNKGDVVKPDDIKAARQQSQHKDKE